MKYSGRYKKERNIGELPPPPRSIPLTVILKLFFAGMVNQLGWLMLGVGIIFTLVIAKNSDMSFINYPEGSGWKTVSGKITEVKESGFKESRKRRYSGSTSKTIYVFSYKYKTPDNKLHYGVSFSTNNTKGTDPKGKNEYSTVTVQYWKAKPDISRIKGFRMRPYASFGLITAVFPLIGLVIVIVGLYNGARAYVFMSGGAFAMGTLRDSTLDSFSTSNNPVYKMIFSYNDQTGREHVIQVKTRTPCAVEDDLKEPLLYNPKKPSSGVLLDLILGSPDINEKGIFVDRKPHLALLWCIIPFLSSFGALIIFISRVLPAR